MRTRLYVHCNGERETKLVVTRTRELCAIVISVEALGSSGCDLFIDDVQAASLLADLRKIMPVEVPAEDSHACPHGNNLDEGVCLECHASRER